MCMTFIVGRNASATGRVLVGLVTVKDLLLCDNDVLFLLRRYPLIMCWYISLLKHIFESSPK